MAAASSDIDHTGASAQVLIRELTSAADKPTAHSNVTLRMLIAPILAAEVPKQ
jgi:hypothetical protein